MSNQLQMVLWFVAAQAVIVVSTVSVVCLQISHWITLVRDDIKGLSGLLDAKASDDRG